jgi:membrane associated rhomboid family serine protease
MDFGSNIRRDTPVVLNLIIINALVFFAQVMFKGTETVNRETMELSKPMELFALHHWRSEFFKPHQLITHMFMHGGFFHLLFNMFGLWMFGSLLERLWGPKRFLMFFLACGIAGGIAQLGSYAYDFRNLDYSDPTIQNSKLYILSQISAALGASGAVMGILAAYGYLFPNTEMIVFPIPIPIKAKWAILGIIAIDVFGGVSRPENDNVAHFAHLGGALAGFLIVYFWNKTKKQTFY